MINRLKETLSSAFVRIFIISLIWFGTAAGANMPPVFAPVSSPIIAEGELLTLSLAVTDADGDPITIGVTERPFGASFTDHGDGTAVFSWRPDYTGPNSSDNSPFAITFRASDGTESAWTQLEVTVINQNRRPLIDPVDELSFFAGEPASFNVTGTDPDNDPLSWEVVAAPEGLVYDFGNQAEFTWSTTDDDVGLYEFMVILSDIHGASDTAQMNLRIMHVNAYTLSIDTVSGYPGQLITVGINMKNLEEVSGFNLLVQYDASILIPASIKIEETRAADFEYFHYIIGPNNMQGDIRITGLADLDDGVAAENLPPGDGSIVNLRFYASNDYNFSGYLIPIRFVFRDMIYNLDNTLKDADGGVIPIESIEYNDGYVFLIKADYSSLGDINLNGVTYEIADVVTFINYIIDPGSHPLSPEQLANTDVNEDGLVASIADLVYMVNRLIGGGGGSSSKLSPYQNEVEITAEYDAGEFSFYYDSEIELGGLFIDLESGNAVEAAGNLQSDMERSGMDFRYSVNGNSIRLIIYSESGLRMPAGRNQFVRLPAIDGLRIKETGLSSAEGAVLDPVLKETEVSPVPSRYELYQNYPNPFNPATEIRFVLPQTSDVSLTVYNLLGQEVNSLLRSRLPAGEHSIGWDGTDNAGMAVTSGIYFYRLQADGYTVTKKMILLK